VAKDPPAWSLSCRRCCSTFSGFRVPTEELSSLKGWGVVKGVFALVRPRCGQR
jgi:hypothetical protein